MFIGIDKNGNYVDIEDVLDNKNEKYFCPCCDSELVIRHGKIVVPHFSHKAGSECDTFTQDMSEWHRNWQAQFPKEYREVVIELEISEAEYERARISFAYKDFAEHMRAFDRWCEMWGLKMENGECGETLKIKHRADVCFGDYVIEFQNSPISSNEFDERNWFYNAAGYNVVWIFNMIDLFKGNNIILINEKHNGYHHGGKYKWNFASKTFLSFTPQDRNSVKLFFQVSKTDFKDNDNGYLERVTWAIPEPEEGSNFKRFLTDYYPGNLNLLMKYIKSNSEQPEHDVFNRFDIKKYYDTIYTQLSYDDFNYEDSEYHNSYIKQVPLKNKNVQIGYMFPDGFGERYGHEENIMESHKADICINGYVIIPSSSFPSLNEFQKRNLFYYYAGYKTIWIFNISEYINEGLIECKFKEENRNRYKCSEINNDIAKTFRYYSFKNKSNDTMVIFQTKKADLNSDDSYLEELVYASCEKKGNILAPNFKNFWTNPRIKNFKKLLEIIDKKPHEIQQIK